LVVDDFVADAAWVREIRSILTDADASAWRVDRADDLRLRVTAVVTAMRARLKDRPSAPERDERTRALVTTMESALPTEPTRARWAAFVGVVHPEYEALVISLPGEVAPRTVRPTNYSRSFFHFISAAVGVVAVGLIPSRSVILGIAIAFAVYAWSMEIGRRRSRRMNEWLMRLYSKVSHPHERYRINSATWFATALVILALIASRPATMASLAILGVADPVAALVGRRWGRHRLRSGRSLEGMLGFIASGALVSALALVLAGELRAPEVVVLALVGATVGAVVELVTTRLDDNLTIPIAVGGAVTLAASLVHG
jgi:dolichol kinase